MAITREYIPNTTPDGFEVNFLAQMMSLIQRGYPVELKANEIHTWSIRRRHTHGEIVVAQANALDQIVLKVALRDDGKLELQAWRKFWVKGKLVEGVIINFFNGEWEHVRSERSCAVVESEHLLSVVERATKRADGIPVDYDNIDNLTSDYVIVTYTI